MLQFVLAYVSFLGNLYKVDHINSLPKQADTEELMLSEVCWVYCDMFMSIDSTLFPHNRTNNRSNIGSPDARVLVQVDPTRHK